MLGDVMKMAMALLVVSLLTVSALKDRFFARAPSGAAPAPAPAVTPAAAPTRSKWGQVELAPDALSQYHAQVEIDGARIEALVDTGASHVFLKAEDARLLNIDPPASAYTGRSQTANGVARFAPVRLRAVRIGDIVVYDVEAAVAEPGRTPLTLLGMSFLKKLSNFQVADGRFVMRQ
ncbi:aspartyl protease family protein [Rhodoblastus acidophilus]|uniref:Aspartyl protease family protein n=1 Tax=Rhodoblastus acidophilus TaxID=1074 RepID=A0A212R5C5_RHOAC|nr:TIGR02281 family clan AA aspartic protease [Rhodoblastus acidophilus]PPQ36497.1 TIGR02281 family clan AA aspartic protease [Rhodoblastus acidophilus]RAI16667.1 TIGR02281 family clan AA aspartic protease [Rhodoblastus acidophilus]SNB67068.1 aspartyl protease family protein [Rhodoblastus acidophilus]